MIASLVSPYRDSRDFVRGLCRDFVEIWVATPFEECERRDVKGLYAKARHGEIKNFTGTRRPVRAAGDPELTIQTTGMTPEECAGEVIGWLDQDANRGRGSRQVPQLHENL